MKGMDKGTTMKNTWEYTNRWEYVKRVAEGMPPAIITAAVTGGHQKSENPNLPVSPEEQAQAAAEVYAAGASIIHIHARDRADPSKESNDPELFCVIDGLIREKAPDILIDDSQTVTELAVPDSPLLGKLGYWKSGPIEARPDIMALNPGPMTFRGHGNSPSAAYVTTFDDTLWSANLLRERGIKPQVFLYHPGLLDLMEYLIQHDGLDKPYYVQLVFGQQSGIPTSPDSVLYMVRNLPEETVFQTCALGLEEVQVNGLALLLGGHCRTGMEDCVNYQLGEPATGNAQFVERVVRMARDLGRRAASAAETRQMLGMAKK